MLSRRTVAVLVAILSGGSARAGQGPTSFARFRVDGTIAYGIVDGSHVRKVEGDLFGDWRATDARYPLKAVTILVPSQPTKVVGLAGNYSDHLGEKAPPPNPEAFFKVPSCLQRHEGEIVLPKTTEDVHYEGELVVVIGKRAKGVEKGQALSCVLGVTCGCDVSARIWQANDRQWWRAKGCDTFGPCGPFIVSGLPYDRLNLELRINGKVRQKTNTANMIHGVAAVVSFLSEHMTLEPGDLIFMGTPGKTEALAPGDTVEVEIEGVGVLRNHVVASK